MSRKVSERDLASIGIGREEVRVLGLLPLVVVAWADGKLQHTEKARILKIGRAKGWLDGDAAAVLERWLSEPPTSEYVLRALDIVKTMAEQDRGLGAAFSGESLRSIVALCADVANAAGGLFGLRKATSPEEEEAIAEIARMLGVEPDGAWREVVSEAGTASVKRPPEPPGHLILGHLSHMRDDPLRFLSEAMQEHGDVIRLRFGRVPAMALRDPAHFQQVLQDNARNYLRGFAYRLLEKATGRNMVTSEGHYWRGVRRTAQPAFNRKEVEALDGVITAATIKRLDAWEDFVDAEGVVDVSEQMATITFSVIGQMLFSVDLADDATGYGAAIDHLLKHFDSLMSNPLHLPQSIPTPMHVRAKKARAQFDELISECIARNETEDAPHNLLSVLLAARDPETGEALPEEALYNETLALVVAGHETTALGLTWTLYLLSLYPAVRRELLAEIDSVLGDRVPTAADQGALPVLDAVIRESLRLYPPAWIMSREAQAEDWLAGYRIEKGTQMFVSPWLLHRNPAVWENPEAFDPTRFLEEPAVPRHKLAWMPFGAGPHKCIGLGLSMLELKLILPLILRRYRLDVVPGFRPEFDTALTLRPKHGVPMTAHRRHHPPSGPVEK